MEFLKILFSKWKVARARKAMDRIRSKLGKSKIELEEYMHSLAPADKRSKFIPSFGAWFQSQKNLDISIAELLGNYINEYDLLEPSEPDEPVDLTETLTRLKVLTASRDIFESDGQEILDKYILNLENLLRMQQSLWEGDKKLNEIEEEFESPEKDSE